MSKVRRNVMALAAVVVATSSLTLVSLAVAPTAVAGAQTAAPEVDYAAYPAPLPDGCPDGPAALVGVAYENGRGGQEGDLRRLDLRSGDTLTMTWADYAAGCRTASGGPAIVVSMAAHDAGAATFDPGLDQPLLAGWTSCGPGQGPCPGGVGAYRLSVALPGAEVTCTIQTGAIIGVPLAVVGPSGSYYSAATRGDDRPTTLIGAANFATSPCPPPTTVASAPLPLAVTTTTSTALPVAAGIEVTQVPTSASTTTPGRTEVEAARASLPATGWGDGRVALAGATALAVGALVLALRRTMLAGRTRRSS